MPWYSAGGVAVSANSETVTGTGTAFAANARVGDAFIGPDGALYEVVNIASDTVLSIFPPYLGTSDPNGSYLIAPIQGYNKESADRLRAIVDAYGPATDLIPQLQQGITELDAALAQIGGLGDAVAAAEQSASSADSARQAAEGFASSTATDRQATETAADDAATDRAAAEQAASAASQSATSAQEAAAIAAAAMDIGAGWTPVMAIVVDGDRAVLQVTDWTGGEANKPATGMYVGPAGFVATAAEAVNIRPDGGGTVESVNGVLPDANGNIELNPSDVGALANDGTAANSSKLGGQDPSHYATQEDLEGLGAAWGDITGNLADQDDLKAALEAKAADADIDFTIIYPNGGSEASPGLAAANTRYVVVNPWPGHAVLCVAEVLYGGDWGDPGQLLSGSTATGGIHAAQRADEIVIKTGVHGVMYNQSVMNGSFEYFTNTWISNIPFRLKVWKVKGAIA